MNRQFVYLGQQPLETDILNTNLFAMIGLAKLAEVLLGTSTQVAGLPCTPTAPASLQIQVGAGQIYSMAAIDSTAYSSLPADTVHTILKQGLLMDTTLLDCPAPVIAGKSINYLVQAKFEEVDEGEVVLNYYNSTDPTQAFAGPNNNGAAQATYRRGKCTVAVKAGVAADTGTQETPVADAGWVGLYWVDVAYGQTTITVNNIHNVVGAPFIKSASVAARKWAYFFHNRMN